MSAGAPTPVGEPVHVAPGVVEPDVVSRPGPLATEDLTGACEAAPGEAYATSGMPSEGMGDQYA